MQLPQLLPGPAQELPAVSALAIDQQGELLLAGCTDKSVRLWRLQDRRLLQCWSALQLLGEAALDRHHMHLAQAANWPWHGLWGVSRVPVHASYSLA